MKKVIALIIIRLISYLLSYISYFFLTFIACEIITIILITITNTQLEKMFVMIISYTPTLGLWGKDTFSLGKNEVMLFFSFWSLVSMIILNIINKLFKFHIKITFILIIFTILHLLAILKLMATDNAFIGILAFFYCSSLISFFVYKTINTLSGIILRLKLETIVH